MRLESQEFSKCSELKTFVFLKQQMSLSKKIMNILQIAKGCKFAVECDWICKISQNVQNLGFLSKERWFFQKKILTVLKMAKGSKFAVECDWNRKSFRKVQNWKLSFF